MPVMDEEAPSGNIADTDEFSSIVANLKVSRVLIQQANSSLDAVERRLHDKEMDLVMGLRDAPRFAASSSSSNLSGCSTAVGPPSQYRLQHGMHPLAKGLEEQLLTGEFKLMSQEEIAYWRSHFPHANQQYKAHCLLESPSDDYTTKCPLKGADHTKEELSHYSSALEDSFINMRPTKKLQAARGRCSRGPERSHQQQPGAQDRPSESSELSDSLEEDRPTPQPIAGQPALQATWTNEVSDLVARMTRGHLGAGSMMLRAPGSRDSKDVQGVYRPKRKSRTTSCSSSSSSSSVLHWVEETAQLGRNLAGVQSEDVDFQSANQSFNQTFTFLEGEGITQTTSSQDHVEVTVEVCRQALLDTKHTEYEIVQRDSGEIDPKPVVSGAQARFPLTTNMTSGLADLTELAELSSITCSPAQLQEKLYASPLSRPAPPCNSTPRNPERHQRVMGGIIKASLLDSSSMYLNTDSFTTAIDDPRDSSPPSLKADSLSSPQDFNTASQEEGVPTDTIASNTVEGDQKGTQLEEEEGTGGPGEEQREERQEMEGEKGKQQRAKREKGEEELEEEGLGEMEEGLERMEESGDREGDIGEEEGKCLGLEWSKHIEEANVEEELSWCGPQGELASKVEEKEDEEDVYDKEEEMVGLLLDGEKPGDKALVGNSSHSGNLDPDPVEDKDPGWAPGSLEGPSLLEETNRAHSTLDEVLQGFAMERMRRSPGPGRLVTALSHVYEAQAGEGAGSPAGDHADRDEHKVSLSDDRAAPPSANDNPTEELGDSKS